MSAPSVGRIKRREFSDISRAGPSMSVHRGRSEVVHQLSNGAFGTKRTSTDVRRLVGKGGKGDVGRTPHFGSD